MRILKYSALCLLGVLVLAGLAVGAGLGYRSYRQHRNVEAIAIRTPNGIQEGRYVAIGGLRQWIQIRGQDRGNPVILFVHGGPAMTMIPFTYLSMKPWERDFTVVQWDQRGAGRTFLLNGDADKTTTGMDQIVADGIAVTQFIRDRLHKERIIVVGESWGSAVALEMARRRPDLFYAFVGTGQLVDMARSQQVGYQLLMQLVRAERDDKAEAQLLALGPPPYANQSLWLKEEQIMADHPPPSERHFGLDFLFAPGYSLWDSMRIIGVATQHRSKLVAELDKYSAPGRGEQFGVPIFFFQGSEDIQAPLLLARKYMDEIAAPRKALVVIPGGGHNSFIFYSQRFLDELNARVRPLAMQAH